MDAKDNTKDLIDLLGGNAENAPDLPCGWAWYARECFDHGYHVTATGEGIGVRKTTVVERMKRLIVDGAPQEIICFDNSGETWDRYTVLFTGPYIHLTAGAAIYIGMSARPTDPQGFGQHGEAGTVYVTLHDHADYAHWGKRIKFKDLPEECQAVVMNDYRDLWDLRIPEEATNATNEDAAHA